MILLPVGLRCEYCGRKWIGYATSVTDDPPKEWGLRHWSGADPVCLDCVDSGDTSYSGRSESDAYFAVIEVLG